MKFLSSNDHLVHDLQQLLRRRYGRFLRAFLLLLSFIERGKPRTQAIHHVHRLGEHVTQAGVALLGHPAYVSLILTGLTHHRRKSGARCQCVRRSESPDLPYLSLDRHRHHVTYARDRLQQSDVLVRIRYVTYPLIDPLDLLLHDLQDVQEIVYHLRSHFPEPGDEALAE